MRVREWKEDIVFLHEVAAGTADRSYGVHVAKLAGLPPAVITRAEQVLEILESTKNPMSPGKTMGDLPLFSSIPKEAAKPKTSPVHDALKDLDPDTMSPKDALDALYALKNKLNSIT